MATSACLGTHLTFHTHKTHPRHTPSLTWYPQRHQQLPKCFILTSSALVVTAETSFEEGIFAAPGRAPRAGPV